MWWENIRRYHDYFLHMEWIYFFCLLVALDRYLEMINI